MNLMNRIKCFWNWLPAEQRYPAFVVLLSFGTILLFSALYSTYQAYWASLVFLLISPIHVLEVWLIVRKNQIKTGSWIFLLGTSLYITLGIYFSGGTFGPFFYWFALLPLVGGHLLKRAGIRFSVFAVITGYLSIYLLEQRYTDWMFFPDALFVWLTFVIFIVLVTILCIQFTKNQIAIYNERARKLESLLSIVTHDIASPLTLINHNVKKLLKKEDPENGQEARTIYRAVGIVQEVLGRVRMINAIKSGKIIAGRNHATLQECYEQLRFIYAEKAREKAQHLEIDCEGLSGGLAVAADPVLLVNEVLGNILSNAIKFSPADAHIMVKTSRKDKQICIEVRDEGIGIPDELLPYIFEPNRATTRPGTEGERGTGFGLPLMKTIVGQWGGRIKVKSLADGKRGTTFFVYLPEAAT